jgi:hypothetical protein
MRVRSQAPAGPSRGTRAAPQVRGTSRAADLSLRGLRRARIGSGRLGQAGVRESEGGPARRSEHGVPCLLSTGGGPHERGVAGHVLVRLADGRLTISTRPRHRVRPLGPGAREGSAAARVPGHPARVAPTPSAAAESSCHTRSHSGSRAHQLPARRVRYARRARLSRTSRHDCSAHWCDCRYVSAVRSRRSDCWRRDASMIAPLIRRLADDGEAGAPTRGSHAVTAAGPNASRPCRSESFAAAPDSGHCAGARPALACPA